MKKLAAILLSTIMISSVFMMTGCSSDKKDNDKDETEVEETSEEDNDDDEDDDDDDEIPNYGNTLGGRMMTQFVIRISDNGDIDAVAQELCAESISGYNCATMPVEEGYLNGFDDSIDGFNEGVMFSPLIGSVPFVAYIFETDNPEALREDLLAHADPRWNICTEADETFAEVYENYVFFCMVPNE